MLNENLKTLRKAKGLSQEELAIRLNVVRQTISKWEKGLSVPDAGVLMKIADELDTSVNVLLGEPIAQEEPEPISTLAEKLEALNEKFAQQNESRRKRWRIVFIVIGILALFGIVQYAFDFIYSYQANNALGSNPAMIGGVDTSTSVYVSSISLHGYSMLFTGIAAIVSVVGIIKTKRK